MNIANYTTEVPASKTAYEVVALLGEHKAKSIQLDYENGEPSGVSFLVDVRTGEGVREIAFKLPCNWRGTAAALLRHQIATKKQWKAQHAEIPPDRAKRVAWRCLRDWIRAQFALIEIGAASLDQVMLPYAMTNDGTTIYQRMIATDFGRRALPEGGGA